MKEELFDKMNGTVPTPVPTKRETKVSAKTDKTLLDCNMIDMNMNFFLVVRSWSDGSVECKLVEKSKVLTTEWTEIP